MVTIWMNEVFLYWFAQLLLSVKRMAVTELTHLGARILTKPHKRLMYPL